MSDKIDLNNRQKQILKIANKVDCFALSDVLKELDDSSPATVRRNITSLVNKGLLIKTGQKKGAKYSLSTSLLFIPFELNSYYKQDVDDRGARTSYNFDVLGLARKFDLLTDSQMRDLKDASKVFRNNAKNMSPELRKKELERFVIEFSWKSSKIEGNTYTLLDTEALLRSGIAAEGKTEIETKMILNHKDAYLFSSKMSSKNQRLSRAYLEEIHRILTSGLGVQTGLRNNMVGISGSAYAPIPNKLQIIEQLELLIDVINSKNDPYEQALLAVVGISYLQPFEDGNKRTARVLANSILLSNNLAPLSYRSVSERDYKEALLVFYEQNSIVPFRELFVEQYIYSATHYNIAE